MASLPDPDPGPRPVVAAYDGSAAAVRALRWAAAEAAAAHHRLLVVKVLPIPSPFAPGRPGMPRHVPRFRELQTAEISDLERVADDTRARYPGLLCAPLLLWGEVDDELAALSEDADLVVVGVRRFRRPRLRPRLAARLVRRSRCPVVSVPSRFADPGPSSPVPGPFGPAGADAPRGTVDG